MYVVSYKLALVLATIAIIIEAPQLSNLKLFNIFETLIENLILYLRYLIR